MKSFIDLGRLVAKVVRHDMPICGQAFLQANDAEENYFGEGWVRHRETMNPVPARSRARKAFEA